MDDEDEDDDDEEEVEEVNEEEEEAAAGVLSMRDEAVVCVLLPETMTEADRCCDCRGSSDMGSDEVLAEGVDCA